MRKTPTTDSEVLFDENLFVVTLTMSIPVVAKNGFAAAQIAKEHTQHEVHNCIEDYTLINSRAWPAHKKFALRMPYGIDDGRTCSQVYCEWQDRYKKEMARRKADKDQLRLFEEADETN